MQLLRKELTNKPKIGSAYKKRQLHVYFLMTIPALVLFFIFHTLPVLQGVFYSFTNSPGYGDYHFVGLKNYINLFKDTRVWHAYLFTFKFAIVATIAVNVLSLLLAVLLNEKIRLKKLLRAVFFFPYILSVLIVGYIFNYIFTYCIPGMAKTAGITILSKSILGNPDLALIGVVIVTVWQMASMTTLLYLAGLQTVSEEIYESASIDGAGRRQQFWSITFPLIAPFFTINIVWAMKNFLMVFDQIMALTDGGPGFATESISKLIYQAGFQGGEFAFQSADAVIFFLVILAISLFQIQVLQKREVAME
jgi:raffinose/stachyose/melibiose transport system permease protein